MLVDLVRHGETQAAGLLLGRTDPPPTASALRQFEQTTAGLVLDAVVTSPRQRARLPAEALAAARRLLLQVDADWAEIDFGDWDGRALAELQADPATAEALAAIYRRADAAGAPGGEDWRAFQARVGRGIDNLLSAHAAESRVLVATHAGPMRAALALACAIPFANLWAFRIGLGTRITLRMGRDERAGLWGEVIEIAQP